MRPASKEISTMTDTFNVGECTVRGGFFLVNRASSKPAPFMGTKSQGDSYEHCFTYQGSESTIKEAALRLIRDARQKVFIASFRIGDKDLLNALYEAVDRLRGGVYVISALDESSLARGLQDLDDDVGIDIQAQKKDFTALAQKGIYVRGHECCHAKFIAVDDREALVSSANLESSAFFRVKEGGRQRGPTGENGVLVRDREQALLLSRLFTRMWFEECTWEILPSNGAAAVAARKCTESPCTVMYRKPRNGGVVWTDDDEHFIVKAIHETIASTREDLILSTFSLNKMTERPEFLIEPVSKLMKDRAPSARLLLRVRNHFATHRRDAELLSSLGVQVFADDLNHAKGIISDRQRGILFSANFDADHGLCNGVEAGTILPPGSSAVQDAADFFEHSMAHCRFRFSVDPTQAVLSGELAVGWQAPWPLGNTVRVATPAAMWNSFLQAGEAGPVLFTENGAGGITLLAGQSRFSLLPGSTKQEPRRLEHMKGETAPTAALLEEWLNRHGPRDARGGVCPAIFHLKI
jgi:hypothetical protein